MDRKKSIIVLVVILLISLFAVESFTKFRETKTVNVDFAKKVISYLILL